MTGKGWKLKLRKAGYLILINLFILALLFTLVEVLFRIFPIVKINWVEGNDQTGFTIPAYYTENLVYPEHPDHFFSYRSNNLGFREDKDTQIRKSDSVRIVVLGDSHTDGVCWNRESYPNRLEYYLNQASPNKTYEVINAGTGKYSPFQYLRAYQFRIKPLKPDIVIIGFYIGNDFFDMYRRDDRPSCSFNHKGEIVELPPQFYFYAQPGFNSSWRSKSFVYYLFFGSRFWKGISYKVTRAIIFYRNISSMGGASFSQVIHYFITLDRLAKIHRHATTQSLAQEAFFHYFPGKRDESFKLVEYVFRKFLAEQRQQPFRLIVVPIPTKIEIESQRLYDILSQVEKKRPDLCRKSFAAFDDSLYDDLISVLKKLKIEYIDLRPLLHEKARQQKLYYCTDFHLNPVANDLIGEKICHYLLNPKEKETMK
ncbi:MAG: hypothetical protein GWP06_07260 [Actinobacteria bacterium]|nr:hypothetical protein [Actinomycetota bacterium]